MKALRIGGGIVVTAIGLGFVFPAVAQLRDLGALPVPGVGLLFLGVFLSLAGVGAIVFDGMAKRT